MKRIISLVLCFLLVFTMFQPVLAEEGSIITWTGATSDDWNEPGNWDKAQVPGTGDTAVITTPAAVAVVYNSATASLDCSGEVSVASGGQLNLTGTSYLRGNNAKLDGDGNITLTENSELQWSGGMIDGTGQFILESGSRLVVDTETNVALCRYFENGGQITADKGELYLYRGGMGVGSFEVSEESYVFFEEGSYSFGGDFVNSGNVIIWEDATVSFGSFRQESTGSMDLKVWGTGSGQYGKLNINGQAQLGGVLEIDFLRGYEPQLGDSFEILTCGSRAGEFSAIICNMEDEDMAMVPTYTDTGLTLTVGEAPEPGENVCEIPGKGGYTTLAGALAAAQDGDTIRLLKDITYKSCIAIIDKSITFDLNGFDLNVDNIAAGSDPHEVSGLYVKGNAAVNLTGEGEFNVQGSCYGVYAEGDGDTGGSEDDLQTVAVTVTNATGVLKDGIFARYATVTVRENVASWGGDGDSGVMATDHSIVIVEGNVHANGDLVTGVTSEKDAEVTVRGNVEVNGKNSIGLNAGEGGDITVEGDIKVTGEGDYEEDNTLAIYLRAMEGQPSVVTFLRSVNATRFLTVETETYTSEFDYMHLFYDPEADPNYIVLDLGGSCVRVEYFSGGTGSADNPYLIASPFHLNSVMYFTYRGERNHYKQITDIDLRGFYSLGPGWDPIGNSEMWFNGVYDGDGYSIKNLTVNRPGQGDVGLFGVVGPDAEIKNLSLVDVKVEGSINVGALAGNTYYYESDNPYYQPEQPMITNCSVTGTVKGRGNVGGLIGYNRAIATDSSFDGTVTQEYYWHYSYEETAGGLIGENDFLGVIDSCRATGTVTSESLYTGGLVGLNRGQISNSEAACTVIGKNFTGGLIGLNYYEVNDCIAAGYVEGDFSVGGLIGEHYDLSYITGCHFSGTVKANDSYAGGLIGDNYDGMVYNCYANDVTVTCEGNYTGGLIGKNYGNIMYSYSTGTINGKNYVGGLIGYNDSEYGTNLLHASYSICDVEGETYVGGLIGYNEARISQCYSKGKVECAEIESGHSNAGGLVGYNTCNEYFEENGQISNSYSWSSVKGKDMLGGLVGYNNADVINCYALGKVEGSVENSLYIGPLFGHHNYSGGTITACFWNPSFSGLTGEEHYGTIGYYMKDRNTFTREGWDFVLIWDTDTRTVPDDDKINNGFPYLRWQLGLEFAGGMGTEENPYIISEPRHLYNVRNHLDKHFKQVADLDMTGYSFGSGWEPIGTAEEPFTGSYNGGGYTISYLYCEREGIWHSPDYTGLFGYTGEDARIFNLLLENVDITGRYYVGALVGYNKGEISNVYVDGYVRGERYTGGLVGYNAGSISDSSFQGDVISESMGDNVLWTGGLAGYNQGTVYRCMTVAFVISEGDYVGGLAGENDQEGIITESYSCYCEVRGVEYTGGFVGYNSGQITRCYSVYGSVTGNSAVGGLVGLNAGQMVLNTGLISESYAAVEIYSDGVAGGLAGVAYEEENITGCYWDVDISGKTGSDGGVGKTTDQMKLAETYEGWDFYRNWDINDIYYDGYPFLRWEEPDPPVISDTRAEDVTDTTATLCFRTDKSGIYYFLVIPASYTPPGEEIIKAQEYNATAKGTGIALLGENRIGLTGLGPNMQYKAYLLIEYSDRNTSETASIFLETDSPPQVTVPGAPQNLSATPGDGQVTLSWSAPASDGGSPITHYLVSIDNGATWQYAGTDTSYTFTGLTNGTTYTFKVAAMNIAGRGLEATITATPVAAAATVPSAPLNLSATAGDGQVVLSWSEPESNGGAAILYYEVSIDNGATWIEVTTGKTHTFTGLTNGTAYTFRVRAVNIRGSGVEASITATPTATPVTTYTVTVNGSYAASSGAGTYAEGETVTINAGSRANYRFSGWTSSDGVTFANAGSATTTFIMPARDVTVTANWTYITHIGDDDDDDSGETGDGGEESGSGDTGSNEGDEGDIPPDPAYEAQIIMEGTEDTLPVEFDQDTGIASVDVSSQGLEQGENIIIMPSIPEADTYLVGIPVPELSTPSIQRTLTVNTDAGNITIPSNMLTGVEGVDGNMARISIGQGDKSALPDDVKAAIGDRPLIRLTLSIDGKQTGWNNPNAPVTVSIPYTPTAEELENPESIVVWYIDGYGNVVTIINGRYDPETGMVTFSTAHFSNYAVVYNKVSFSDVAEGVWYHKAVSFMAARGIISGMGDGNFNPEEKLTRAALLVMVMKAYGIAPDTQPADNFADAGDTWYTGYLAAAKRLGISSGVGDNLFMPEKEVTREEMFTLLYNILEFIGQLPQGDSGKTLSDFSDAYEIATWAEEAVKHLVETGTVSGIGNMLLPKDTTTRAQMAQMLYNLLSKQM